MTLVALVVQQQQQQQELLLSCDRGLINIGPLTGQRLFGHPSKSDFIDRCGNNNSV